MDADQDSVLVHAVLLIDCYDQSVLQSFSRIVMGLADCYSSSGRYMYDISVIKPMKKLS